MLNGPNGPVGNFSLIEVAELQMAYVLQLLDRLREGATAICPTRAAMEEFEAARVEASQRTVWVTGCRSWYLDDRGVPATWPWTFDRFREQGRMRGPADLYTAIHERAVKRIRPKTMTVATDMIGLLPLLWATGTGADVTRRLVAPLIGGITVSFVMELLVYPVIFYLWKRWELRRTWRAGRSATEVPATGEVVRPNA